MIELNFFFACGGCGCGGSAVCTFVISATFFNLVAELYSRDFGSVFVFSSLRWASAAYVPTYGYLFEKHSLDRKDTDYCRQTASTKPPPYFGVKAYVAQSSPLNFWVACDKIEIIISPVVLTDGIFAKIDNNKSSLPVVILQKNNCETTFDP